jgi:hypothetical protein
MTLHSPGPWAHEDVGPTEAVRYMVRDATGRMVCALRSEIRGEPGEHLSLANVKLIDATPDMLEALAGVSVMLRTELAKYAGEPWAQRVVAALLAATEGR